jgi:hypothetical protein
MRTPFERIVTTVASQGGKQNGRSWSPINSKYLAPPNVEQLLSSLSRSAALTPCVTDFRAGFLAAVARTEFRGTAAAALCDP